MFINCRFQLVLLVTFLIHRISWWSGRLERCHRMLFRGSLWERRCWSLLSLHIPVSLLVFVAALAGMMVTPWRQGHCPRRSSVYPTGPFQISLSHENHILMRCSPLSQPTAVCKQGFNAHRRILHVTSLRSYGKQENEVQWKVPPPHPKALLHPSFTPSFSSWSCSAVSKCLWYWFMDVCIPTFSSGSILSDSSHERIFNSRELSSSLQRMTFGNWANV